MQLSSWVFNLRANGAGRLSHWHQQLLRVVNSLEEKPQIFGSTRGFLESKHTAVTHGAKKTTGTVVGKHCSSIPPPQQQGLLLLWMAQVCIFSFQTSATRVPMQGMHGLGLRSKTKQPHTHTHTHKRERVQQLFSQLTINRSRRSYMNAEPFPFARGESCLHPNTPLPPRATKGAAWCPANPNQVLLMTLLLQLFK